MNSVTNRNTNTPVITDIERFYGFFDNIYRDPYITGRSFIFMTRPRLFLQNQPSNNSVNQMAYINMTRDPNFVPFLIEQKPNDADKSLFLSLSFNDYNKFPSHFLPIITNNCKNFDPLDTNVEQMEAFETKQGFKQVLPTFKTTSETSGSLTINVTDDINLTFTKMMNIWVNYISNITDGTFDANPEMIKTGTLDYMCSIYYFSLDADGKTIKYWSRYTGCWPSSIPYGSIRYSKGSEEPLELDLQFNYTVKEDMNPKILEEFNITSLNLNVNELPSYIINGLYPSFVESPLLNRNKIVTDFASKFSENGGRDPLVLYVNASNNGINSDEKKGHYELSFDATNYTMPVISDIIDDGDHFINYIANDLILSDNNKKYNETDYWK